MLAINREGLPPASPFVSILIAARNEETTISDCLRALNQLNFPADCLEVLIGNDQSTDQTAAAARTFIADKPHFRLISVAESIAGLMGKANVLAQLARQSQGQYLFFTDADTQVPVDWISVMIRQFTDNVGIVTGITLPEGPTLFHKLQTIDWLYNLTLTHVISSLGIPVTAMGNNMAVSRAAYEAVGGYESLPFSVVEDYTLFRAIVGRGFDFRNLLHEQVLAHTKPVDTMPQWLHQRKRWMRGATHLPLWMVVSLYGQYLAGPLLLLLGLVSPILAFGLYIGRLFLQTLLLSVSLSRLHRTSLWPYALLFEIYQLVIGPLAVVFYWLPMPLYWKGRTY